MKRFERDARFRIVMIVGSGGDAGTALRTGGAAVRKTIDVGTPTVLPAKGSTRAGINLYIRAEFLQAERRYTQLCRK